MPPSPVSSLATISPFAFMTAEMPVFAARMMGRPFLDGAHSCGCQTLFGSDAGAEPGIVRRGVDAVGPEKIIDYMVREWDFVADCQGNQWCTGQCQPARPWSG